MRRGRVWVVALFLLIGVVTVSKILVQSRGLRQELMGEIDARYEQNGDGTFCREEESESRRQVGRLLDRLLLLAVTVPFLCTVLLLTIFSV